MVCCVFKFQAFGWYLCSFRKIEVTGVEGEGGVSFLFLSFFPVVYVW